jgi:predicted alpha/beta superfamily hydrolase
MFLQAQNNNNLVTIGKIDSIYSPTLKEQRKFWVYNPDGNEATLYGQKRYPVLYLLDGDGHFSSVVGMIQQLSQINGNTVFPEMIVVGIPNTDRTRDLTPTHVTGGPYVDSNFVKTSGGGENFISFIEHELMPHIDSVQPTAPYKVLVGHSFGGLTAIYTLIHHPDLFNAYLAIDPSMWWDKQKLLKETDIALANKNFSKQKLFLGIANTMPDGMDTIKVRKDTSETTFHIRSILSLADELRTHKNSGLKWNYRYYPEDNHGSVPLITEYDGLHFLFSFYNFKDFVRILDPKINADAAIRLVKAHYKSLTEEMKFPVLPPENLVNELAYGFLGQKSPEKAVAFFNLNIENYPKSFNVYDSMGDYYRSIKDKENAIKNYSKSLELKEVPETRKKLEKVKAGDFSE